MVVHALKCPSCAAPVDAVGRTAICGYCAHVIVDVPDAWASRPIVIPPWTGRPEDLGRPRTRLGMHTYVVQGRLAQGAHCDVFLARRDARLSEMVVLKVLRDEKDAPGLKNEWNTIKRLGRSASRGADYFCGLLPQPIAHGALHPQGHLASIFQWRPGFFDNLTHVRNAYPQGLEASVTVWIWKRMLEFLGWLHLNRTTHGAVLPEHVLIHPRDHGAVLAGWSSASTRRAPREDIAMSAQCIDHLLGGWTASAPRPLRSLVRSTLKNAPDDAWALAEELSLTAKKVFGPSKYVRFKMPRRKGM